MLDLSQYLEPQRAQFFFLRHGDISQPGPSRYVGQRDLPHNPTGQAQTRFWAQALAGIAFAGIYASDLTRCRHMAETVATGQTAPVQYLAGLREISLGAWEGVEVAQVRARWPREYELRGADLAHQAPPGGESFAQLAARVGPCFAALAARAPSPGLVVAHSGVIRTLGCQALDMPLGRVLSLELGYAGLCILTRRAGVWEVSAWNLRPPQDLAAWA